ncbi:DUF805 domain-containing protein [Sandaracinobacter neustonicus]|uniref:DUF805 domain-containing protein n=1 Tax=Sandaracinobacter neustonicus TaxID=1715348 RepID=A0A501XW83_9SPHN|nr:DUF805 domain-containing protein [Sandaracinobacter neustonicus]TPE64593.1 DUF805 domain-containing protein [Sandaracinobacter neustonicus]
MEFGEAIKTCFRKYATFSGRAQRSEYWWWYLFNFLVVGGATIIDIAIFGVGPDKVQPISGILSLGFMLPNLSVTCRRLHDGNRRGWWMLLPLLTFIPLMFLFAGAAKPQPSFAMGGVTIVVGFGTIGLLLYWLIKRGTDGPNRFGPDPLRPVYTEGVF